MNDSVVTEFEFKKSIEELAEVFGTKLKSAAKEAYYREIGHRIRSESHMNSLFRSIIQNETSFPKIATMLKYHSLGLPERRKIDPSTNPLAWITDDCEVVGCDGGIYIVIHGDGLGTAFRCPKCDRSDLTGIPRWNDTYKSYTKSELERRRIDRAEIHSKPEYREKRLKELLKFCFDTFDMAGSRPDKPKRTARAGEEGKDANA